MQESIVFLLRVQCRRKESSRSLSHLLMSFLLTTAVSFKIFVLNVYHSIVLFYCLHTSLSINSLYLRSRVTVPESRQGALPQ